jgi:hypothetical protein
MFLHPQCPCSRATVEELALLMAHCHGRLAAHVFVLKPQEMTTDWSHTDLWRSAERIPGVSVHLDDNGREAQLFGAQTSGDTELFDHTGRLLFHGGITAARGHSGDNAGRDAVEAYVLGQPVTLTSAPVFGCALFSSSTTDTPRMAKQ